MRDVLEMSEGVEGEVEVEKGKGRGMRREWEGVRGGRVWGVRWGRTHITVQGLGVTRYT